MQSNLTSMLHQRSRLAALGLALLGIGLAWRLYGRPSEAPARLRARRFTGWFAHAFEQKLWFDRLYDFLFYRPASRLASGLGRYVEKPLFLTTLTDLGASVRGLSGRVAAAQTGVVRGYALMLAIGLAVLTVVFLLVS